MSAVVVLGKRCARCGGRTRDASVWSLDETETHREIQFISCPGCVEKTYAELANVRPVFDAMLAAGVPRDLANDAMTFLLVRMVLP